MPIALPFPELLSQSTNHDVHTKVDVVQFDDGYADIQPSGINNRRLSINFKYTPLTEAQALQVIAFLETVGGHERFEFTPRLKTQSLKFRVIPDTEHHDNVADLYIISFQALQAP